MGLEEIYLLSFYSIYYLDPIYSLSRRDKIEFELTFPQFLLKIGIAPSLPVKIYTVANKQCSTYTRCYTYSCFRNHGHIYYSYIFHTNISDIKLNRKRSVEVLSHARLIVCLIRLYNRFYKTSVTTIHE